MCFSAGVRRLPRRWIENHSGYGRKTLIGQRVCADLVLRVWCATWESHSRRPRPVSQKVTIWLASMGNTPRVKATLVASDSDVDPAPGGPAQLMGKPTGPSDSAGHTKLGRWRRYRLHAA